jgi:hypothetical protein
LLVPRVAPNQFVAEAHSLSLRPLGHRNGATRLPNPRAAEQPAALPHARNSPGLEPIVGITLVVISN